MISKKKIIAITKLMKAFGVTTKEAFANFKKSKRDIDYLLSMDLALFKPGSVIVYKKDSFGNVTILDFEPKKNQRLV